jgi:hypothetical protein
MNSLVSLTHMTGACITIRVDRNGLDTHLPAGLYYPDCYFATVGYENFFKHSDLSISLFVERRS